MSANQLSYERGPFREVSSIVLPSSRYGRLRLSLRAACFWRSDGLIALIKPSMLISPHD